VLGSELRLGAFTQPLPGEVIDGERDPAVRLGGVCEARDAQQGQGTISK